jgi:hypothetical protein
VNPPRSRPGASRAHHGTDPDSQPEPRTRAAQHRSRPSSTIPASHRGRPPTQDCLGWPTSAGADRHVVVVAACTRFGRAGELSWLSGGRWVWPCGGSSRLQSSSSWPRREQLVVAGRLAGGQGLGMAGGPVQAGAGPFRPNRKATLRDPEDLTVPADCEAFVITGICDLAGTAALRVGLRVRKRSGKRVLGRPPEPGAVGHPAAGQPGSERAPYSPTRPFVQAATTTPIRPGAGGVGWA